MQISHRTLLQLNFQHLRTFLTLAHVENFSRAGEQVGLSQSAVSRHIRALEDSLGLRLFERIGRRAVLTSAGRILRARMETLMREADTLPRVLKDLSEGIQGDIRIGACITGRQCSFASGPWAVPAKASRCRIGIAAWKQCRHRREPSAR